MKRNGKLIALALALALCLLLTGCYVAPDDVSNGGETNPGNNLPFQTLQPTETVTMTPDTVVVETPDQSQQGQSVFPSQATPTPSPGEGGNSWTEWGTTGNPATVTGTPTAVPTGGTIVFDQNTPAPGADSTIQTVTETPTPAIPTTPAPITPTPTPKSMRLGFQGDAVRTVQRKLRDLGYYTGSIDGDFGAETEKAVKAFQKANGLSADGKVGELTLKKLNDKNAKTAKQANSSSSSSGSSKATSAPKSTATPNLQKDYYLTVGSKGESFSTVAVNTTRLPYVPSIVYELGLIKTGAGDDTPGYYYVNFVAGERFPRRGGAVSYGSGAGLGYVDAGGGRGSAFTYYGCRPRSL